MYETFGINKKILNISIKNFVPLLKNKAVIVKIYRYQYNEMRIDFL